MTEQPQALRLADAIDPFVRKHSPDHLTSTVAAAELRRLHEHELANTVWGIKTEWVQQTAQPHELGMHRADVLRQRIDRLHEENSKLRREVAAISANAVDDGRAMSKLEAQLGEAVWNYGEVKRINAQLLEALENLLEGIEGNHVTEGDCNQARAAIAAAKEEA